MLGAAVGAVRRPLHSRVSGLGVWGHFAIGRSAAARLVGAGGERLAAERTDASHQDGEGHGDDGGCQPQSPPYVSQSSHIFLQTDRVPEQRQSPLSVHGFLDNCKLADDGTATHVCRVRQPAERVWRRLWGAPADVVVALGDIDPKGLSWPTGREPTGREKAQRHVPVRLDAPRADARVRLSAPSPSARHLLCRDAA